MKYAKLTRLVSWIILAVSFYLIVCLLANFDPHASDPHMLKWISANLTWSYVLLGTATLAALLLELINTLSDKKAAKNTLIGFGLLGGVILAARLLSDTEMPPFFGVEKFVDNSAITPSMLLWIGTGLITSYLLFGIAVLAIVWSAVCDFFKQ